MVLRPLHRIILSEVMNALKKNETGKSAGPSEMNVKIIVTSGNNGGCDVIVSVRSEWKRNFI